MLWEGTGNLPDPDHPPTDPYSGAPCYENPTCPCSIKENEEDSIIIDALKCRIRWLHFYNKRYKGERDEAQAKADSYKSLYENLLLRERDAQCRLEDALDKINSWVEEVINDV